jgi:hypothetical protein
MAAMTWSATILPLAGVALGSAGTLVGQYLTTRVTVRREEREQAAAERAERKEAIMGFLSSAQTVEALLDRCRDDLPLTGDEARDDLHALWLSKKGCELVCSGRLAQAAHDYTLTLQHLVLRGLPGEVSAAKREHRHAFMEAARKELGVEGADLRRHRPVPDQRRERHGG